MHQWTLTEATTASVRALLAGLTALAGLCDRHRAGAVRQLMSGRALAGAELTHRPTSARLPVGAATSGTLTAAPVRLHRAVDARADRLATDGAARASVTAQTLATDGAECGRRPRACVVLKRDRFTCKMFTGPKFRP